MNESLPLKQVDLIDSELMTAEASESAEQAKAELEVPDPDFEAAQAAILAAEQSTEGQS